MMPARIDGPGVVAETGRGAETLRPGGEVYRMVLFDHDGDPTPGRIERAARAPLRRAIAGELHCAR